ncbi:hypothetical protein D3C86_1885290 [compost metagenome]
MSPSNLLEYSSFSIEYTFVFLIIPLIILSCLNVPSYCIPTLFMTLIEAILLSLQRASIRFKLSVLNPYFITSFTASFAIPFPQYSYPKKYPSSAD